LMRNHSVSLPKPLLLLGKRGIKKRYELFGKKGKDLKGDDWKKRKRGIKSAILKRGGEEKGITPKTVSIFHEWPN